MKLLRFGPKGAEKPGILDAGGRIRDLSGKVEDIAPASIGAGILDRIRSINPESLPLAPEGVRIGPCIATTGHFIAIGLNYADHAAETGAKPPAEPIVFSKAPTSLSGPDDPVIIPKGSTKTDWEVELAIVIGKRTSYVSEAEAPACIAGYAVCNDVSERAFQIEGTGQWIKGKSAETFGPLGPWLVTPDEIADVNNLDMFLDVNGRREQTGNTRTMIFGPAFLVSYISRFMVLAPGDVITTGTPPGVGMGHKPPVYLKPGDRMRLGIAGLGEQNQEVVAWPG
jgi:2,4-diketo-3-deoxy-L-fuconate hydrolase